MKFAIFAVLVVVAVSCSLSEALPQQFRIQKLPYYPPPRQPPRTYRVRRQLGGSVSSNPDGSSDAKLTLSHGIGTPTHNLIGTAYAAGNTRSGPVTTGANLAYNNNGFGAALNREHVPGVRDSFSQSAHANLFSNDKHSVDANIFRSQNKLANGLKFERNGHGLEYSHVGGHGASITQSKIPNFGKQLEVAGRANLWSSRDRNTRLDLTGGASKWTSGPLRGQTDFNTGLRLNHMFG